MRVVTLVRVTRCTGCSEQSTEGRCGRLRSTSMHSSPVFEGLPSPRTDLPAAKRPFQPRCPTRNAGGETTPEPFSEWQLLDRSVAAATAQATLRAAERAQRSAEHEANRRALGIMPRSPPSPHSNAPREEPAQLYSGSFLPGVTLFTTSSNEVGLHFGSSSPQSSALRWISPSAAPLWAVPSRSMPTSVRPISPLANRQYGTLAGTPLALTLGQVVSYPSPDTRTRNYSGSSRLRRIGGRELGLELQWRNSISNAHRLSRTSFDVPTIQPPLSIGGAIVAYAAADRFLR